MTNKEAIEYLRNHTRYYEPVNREAFRVIEDALNKLEQYEKIFNTPLMEIRKQLRVLDILKEFLSEANTGTGWIEINIDPNHDILDSEEYKKKQLLIKEWLKDAT